MYTDIRRIHPFETKQLRRLHRRWTGQSPPRGADSPESIGFLAEALVRRLVDEMRSTLTSPDAQLFGHADDGSVDFWNRLGFDVGDPGVAATWNFEGCRTLRHRSDTRGVVRDVKAVVR